MATLSVVEQDVISALLNLGCNRPTAEAAVRKAKAAFLEVRSTNQAAQALYEKCGFRSIARRTNYYTDPQEDAIVMTLVFGELSA